MLVFQSHMRIFGYVFVLLASAALAYFLYPQIFVLAEPEASLVVIEETVSKPAKKEEALAVKAKPAIKVTPAVESPAIAEEKAKVAGVKDEPKQPKKGKPEAKPVDLTEEELIETMKASVEKKMVSEFTTEGVKKWEMGEKESIGGKEYQIGFATYEKETILGKQPVIGKCLINSGKVTKWIYTKTGADIP